MKASHSNEKNHARAQRLLHYLPHRRIGAFDHLRPQRWNWYLLERPFDRSLERQAPEPLTNRQVRRMRYFWLDGIFAATSEAFYLGFIPIFALAYGATNEQVGWITALGNLAGALALFPGARLMERTGERKRLVIWTGGAMARTAVLFLAFIPLFTLPAQVAIVAIASLNALRAFMANFANPAWTAMVAEIVPDMMRGRYFSARNLSMGLATLIFASVAGWLIRFGNQWQADPFLGYQVVFALAFVFGIIGTSFFSRIHEPRSRKHAALVRNTGNLTEALKHSPGYLGFVVSAVVWNFALQIAAPFFNVYMVRELGADTATIGIVTSISSFSSLAGQLVWGKVMDRRGALFLQLVAGFPIVLLPVMWIFYTDVWQVGINNLFGGFVWAGFNLANFNLLLSITPEQGRARAVAFYQTGVFASAFLGPLAGGFLADAFSFKLIFGLSGAGRLAGMLLFLGLTYWPMRNRQRVTPQAA
ncbi:MAG: MFS transporter [Caldilineaceae bacterium]|nr:MFS transporter [Caldilineaceae bacterium]